LELPNAVKKSIVQVHPLTRSPSDRFSSLLGDAPALTPIPLSELGACLKPDPILRPSLSDLGDFSNPEAYFDRLVTQNNASRPARDYGIHPSGLHDLCDRAFILKARHEGALTPKIIKPSLQRVFDFGHIIHRLYQEDYLARDPNFRGLWACVACKRIQDPYIYAHPSLIEGRDPGCLHCGATAGYRYVEIPISVPECGIIGKVDGVIARGPERDALWWLNVDMKSAGTWAFRAVEKKGAPPPKYVVQQQIYMEGLRRTYPDRAAKLSTTILIYIHKDTSEEMFVKIERDDYMIEKLLKKAKKTWEASKDVDATLPKRRKCRVRNAALKKCPPEIVETCFSLDGK